MRLQGRTALVSGSGHGIGQATAESFAEEGAAVVIVDIDGAKGEKVAAGIRDAGGRSVSFAADITERAQVDEMVAFACRTFGSLDILHNNAYVLGPGRAGELEPEVWDRTIDVCLTAYWYSTKVALVPMLEQGKGVIINTASVAGLFADYTLAAYSAAKAGVVNLTRNVALDYARKGIRCNAICPGPIWTFGERAYERMSEEMAPLVETVPLRRLGRPAEVANLAVFLASDDSSFMTGAHCVIDGGMSAHSGMPSLSGKGADW